MRYKNSKLWEVIEEYIHSERDRSILKRRMIDGLTYDELSLEFNLCERQLKKIVYKYKNMIYELMDHNIHD